MLALCKALHPKYNSAALTNDIFTQEVYQTSPSTHSRIENFLSKTMHYPTNVSVLSKQVSAFLTQANSGSCPHAAIREDISANLHVLEDLQRLFNTEILLIESGGDNLAANYSRELADYIIYVVCLSTVRLI
jgi:urease accessory protein